ncbi:FkbM family methyltransferase [Methylomonas sp. HYX-M1]|uniref:FkbM family methyltransferase n=1 Tax=Methylomonas sp. HYX-M1 TaxID=3139307 RepID=UPI00345C4B22
MKTLINSMIPKRLLPIARKAYWTLFGSKRIDLSKEYESLNALQALKCKISYNRYGGYCVPLSSHHRPAAQKVLAKAVYEPDTIEYMLENCQSGDVVHAGTYFGDFLPALAKGIPGNAKVWAFEPNPENYRCARITLDLNGIENTVLTHAGLGEKQETRLIKTRDANGLALGGASRIVSGNTSDEIGTEAVRIVTIDDTVESDRTVSIIQLDVEGYEKEALAGGLKTIRRCLPIIILEVLPNSTLLGSEWFSNNILSLGYKKIQDLHGNSVFSYKAAD